MGKKSKPTKQVSYSFKNTEIGDMSTPRAKTSGITFEVAPPSTPAPTPPPVSGDLLLEDGVSFLLLEDGMTKLALE